MSYRKQKKLSLLPTRSDGLASFLLISFHRCCPLSFGEAHFCRRRRSQKAITSDQRGFAGVRPTATHAPPANMRSPVLRSPAQSVFRRAGRSSELTVSSAYGSFGYSFWPILLQRGFTTVQLIIRSQDQRTIPHMRSNSGSPHGSAEGFLQTKESTGAMRLCLRA